MKQRTEYAVVDLETTGSTAGRDRITEIAIFVTDGEQILDEFTSLVNPEVSIPPFIARLTGITDNMVREAPRFHEIARRVVEITQGRVFVAHNVSFDYNFLKAEFKRLGYVYQRKRVCTVRLSRKLIPGQKSYSLGKLCRSLGISINSRHRAFGDARATVDVLHCCLQNDTEDLVADFQRFGSPEANMPPNLPREHFEALPETPGVYYFHGRNGKVIYVGKALDVRGRIANHFSSEGSRKALTMREKIWDVSAIETGTELIALLEESHEIKRLQPTFNIQQKRSAARYGLFDFTDRQGYRWLQIGRLKSHSNPHTSFASSRRARSFLEAVHNKYHLCEYQPSQIEARHGCFRYQLGRCPGACIGAEPPERYNARVAEFLNKLNVRGKSLAIVGDGRTPEERSVVWLEAGVYHGYGYFDAELPVTNPHDLTPYLYAREDNHDVQRILNQHLRGQPFEDLIDLGNAACPEGS